MKYNQLTTERFIEKARFVHGDKYDYSKSEYKRTNDKVCIICPEHGEFWQTPHNHLKGTGCPKCSKNYMNTDFFIKKAKEVHGDKYDYSKVFYIDAKTKVCIICHEKDEFGNEHGEFWQLPNSHLQGCGCKKCRNSKLHDIKSNTTINFIEKSKQVHGNRYNYSKVKYFNLFKKVCIICPEHGEFWQTPANHLKGENCPLCHISKIEEQVFLLLKNNNINFEYRKKDFIWLKDKQQLELDFYLPDYNIAIECQGIQHFIPVKYFGGEEKLNRQIKSDKIKNKLCKEHDIEIIYFCEKRYKFNNVINDIESLKEKLGIK